MWVIVGHLLLRSWAHSCERAGSNFSHFGVIVVTCSFHVDCTLDNGHIIR